MASNRRIDPRARTGQLAELAVRNHLTARGWLLIDYNVRWRDGELDLIALDGNALVFGEVKALVATGVAPPFSPFESIDLRKQQRIRKLARRWLVDDLRRLRGNNDLSFSIIRFDAFAVTMRPDSSVRDIEHLSDAF